MQKQYGKEEGKKVYFATIRKQAMKEGIGNLVKGLMSKPKPDEYVNLYHGTTDKAADSILKKGMKGSSKNVTAPGVYDNSAILKRRAFATDDPKTASDYTTEKSSVMFQNSQRIARAMHRSRSRLLSHAAYQARKERTAGSLS